MIQNHGKEQNAESEHSDGRISRVKDIEITGTAWFLVDLILGSPV